MVVITGTVVAKAEHFDEVLRLSTEHVLRSRAEPGCLSHAVLRDTENPLKLVFLEEWADMPAVEAHFVVPASREFGRQLVKRSSELPTITLYDATKIAR